MTSFEVHFGTRVVCEGDAHRRVGTLARGYGHRVLLVTGSGSAQASGALAAVEASLSNAGCDTAIIEGIPSDPSVGVVDAGCRYAEQSGAQVVVALGGGSVIDAAKAIALGVPLRPAQSGLRSIRRLLSGIAGPDDHAVEALPVIAIPTLAGSGSEVNGVCVLTDEVTGRKLSLSSEFAEPRIALVDPALIAAAPPAIAGPGYADALCHAIEAGLSSRASLASDAFAEAAVRSLTRADVDPLGGDPAMAAIAWWGSVEASWALRLAGSIVTHTLSHPLSARAGVRHGSAVAALEPVVIRQLADRWGERAVTVAGWLGSRSAKPAGAARVIAGRLRERAAELGVDEGLAGLELAPAAIELCAHDVALSGSRGLLNTPGALLDEADIVALYDAALTGR